MRKLLPFRRANAIRESFQSMKNVCAVIHAHVYTFLSMYHVHTMLTWLKIALSIRNYMYKGNFLGFASTILELWYDWNIWNYFEMLA